jgi:MFS family permease
MDSTPVSLSAYWRLVRDNPNFRRLWLAQIVSELGDWFYTLSIYSLLLELTGLAASVGLAVVLQVLPQCFVIPTSGVVNDRVSRKKVMIAADLGRAVIVLGMLLVRSPATVWLVYPLLLLQTVMAAFFEPARSSVIPNIAAPEKVLVANTLSSTTWSFNLAVGATLGGAVAALLGRDAVFVLNALSFLVSAWLLRRMRFEEPHVQRGVPLRARELADFTPILEGARYVRSHPRLLATVFVKAGLGFMGANNVILPILGERVFPFPVEDPRRGALLGMSVLMGARGAGALLGPFMAAPWAGQRQPRLQAGILIGFLVAGLGYLAVGLAPSVWSAIAAVVVAHAGGSTIWVFSTTLLHMYTEDRFRGRVFAADLGFLMLTISVSSYAAGLAIDWGVPARMFAIYMGLSVALPAIVWALALRRLNSRP